MGRSVILGNGRLTVGLNEKGLVHDFYYPYVGLENLTTARSMHHRIGVWVDGEFSWTDDEAWETSVDFSADALISNCTYRSHKYKLEITTKDFVDYRYDAFCRILHIKNESGNSREVRIFMHQVFEISQNGRGDTALYVPNQQYILDYKGKTCLLISGYNHLSNASFDQYAVGNYGIEGKQGTYMDAEDGELSGHNIEHGGVDSVIRFSVQLDVGEVERVDYWVVASDSQSQTEKIHSELKDGLEERLLANQLFWENWLSVSNERLNKAQPIQREIARKSLMVIKAHSDIRGGIIASCDSSIYNYGRDYYSYVWPRDGAYAMWPLIRLGYSEEPKSFFRFCADIINTDGYLMHKYQPDRAIGSTWHPLIRNGHSELAIQEDETASVVIMLGEYLDYIDDREFVREMYHKFVKRAADFMASFVDRETSLPHASYDLWEEKFLTSTYTTATVYRALIVAIELAERFGDRSEAIEWERSSERLLDKYPLFLNPDRAGYRKGLLLEEDGSLSFDNTLDASSFYGVMTYGYYPPDSSKDMVEAVKEIESSLLNHDKGCPRYEDDYYFKTSSANPPNSWIISTLWLAQYYARVGKPEETARIINWVHDHMLPSGVMPEQIHPLTGEPISVTPLVWSHAEYINTVLDYTQKTLNQSKNQA